ncbi:YciI family protein [Streptomyces sp. NBC_01006]|uniref:YciI family protein n=1 Tax=Streptomyces sp. NBC_01006 TaxID=2903716 RepID=UPI00387021FE|nr:YciI family protein [Streptomyces sp. NBC_01006]
MFIVTVAYTAPLEDVEPWRPAHGDWLKQQIARRSLLVAGRQKSLAGGVYLAPGMPAEELDRLLASDPYVVNGVAHHTVTEFTPHLVVPGLEALTSYE